MASVSTVSSTAGASSAYDASSSSSTASRVPQKTLGRDDFMKLLAVQFQMQDPMKPMEDTAFIAQTAQFSALEQSTNMADELTKMNASQARSAANSYLGHHVTIDVGSGQTVSGDVTAVDDSGTAPQIVVNGQAYGLSSVLRVEPGTVSTPAAQTGGA